jgi:DNA-directed RNA polymerase I and III subunit RPAC1
MLTNSFLYNLFTNNVHANFRTISIYPYYLPACATYRLMPDIQLLEPIYGPDAIKFASCFPPGVISLSKNRKTGTEEATVSNARYDTLSRECLRHPEFKDRVLLKRIPDHFIFQVESVGFYAPPEIIVEAIKILAEKAHRLRECLN